MEKNLKWLLLMAWRDSRKNKNRLLLFMSAIVLGIAALVAINSFSENLQQDIENEARGLTGADLVVRGRQPLSDSLQQYFDSVSVDQAREVSFASMLLFPDNGGTRLLRVRALQGNFPFYGEIETSPAVASRQFRQGQQAIVDNSVLIQFNARPGDSVRIGNLAFGIAGSLLQAPGEAGISASVAPSVYIPFAYLEQTGLVQKGSRINYEYFYKFKKGYDVEAMRDTWDEMLDKESMRLDTVEERKEDLGRAFSNLTRFLNLSGFIALLLGCVGVASSVHIYVKEKIGTVAVLRCLGASGWQAFLIYLLQIAIMGFAGSVAGALLGSTVQYVLPSVLKDFLPFSVTLQLSWVSIISGIVTGVVVSVLFAAIPLLGIRRTSPVRTLRASFEDTGEQADWLRRAVYAIILLCIFGFSWWQIGSPTESGIFTLSLVAAFALLTGAAQLLMWLVKRYFPASWSYTWRQGMANLYRPQNQTLILVISIGLGTALITTLFFVQNLLLDQVALTGSEEQPNMVLFDIQSPQKEEVEAMVTRFDLPLIQQVPVVNMKVEKIRGITKAEAEADSTLEIDDWVYNRENRVTYRDQLIDSETLVAGEWQQTVQGSDSVFVSIDEGFARRMGVEVGDEIVFNVQGTPLTTYVGSLREIDWQRVQTNFLFVFPAGALEDAPQFHVVVTRVNSDKQSAQFQQAVVRQFPNVSVIDLGLILKTLDNVLDKVSFAIRFMALFSIITGLIVLAGSVIISKYQRIQESVLLRTLGANRRQVLKINALEYFLLGGLASVCGILLALASSWALAIYNFETVFVPDFLPALVVFGIITFLTMLIGVANSRGVLGRPPLEILRSEL